MDFVLCSLRPGKVKRHWVKWQVNGIRWNLYVLRGSSLSNLSTSLLLKEKKSNFLSLVTSRCYYWRAWTVCNRLDIFQFALSPVYLTGNYLKEESDESDEDIDDEELAAFLNAHGQIDGDAWVIEKELPWFFELLGILTPFCVVGPLKPKNAQNCVSGDIIASWQLI